MMNIYGKISIGFSIVTICLIPIMGLLGLKLIWLFLLCGILSIIFSKVSDRIDYLDWKERVSKS